jgi:hypothetical protein
MSGKKILYKDEARRALMNGMGIMVEAVSLTLGPKGRNVVLEKKYGSPQIINDGVSIAKEIELLDNIENTGVSLIRQAASKTNDVAGGLYVENPKHFSGNFWWANSDYIKTLPTLDPKNIKEYNRGEFWICSNTEKIYPVSMNGPIDLYQNYYLNESDFIKGF